MPFQKTTMNLANNKLPAISEPFSQSQNNGTAQLKLDARKASTHVCLVALLQQFS